MQGITLPSDGIPGYVKGDDGGAIADDDIPSNESAEREAKSAKPNESSMDALPNRKMLVSLEVSHIPLFTFAGFFFQQIL